MLEILGIVAIIFLIMVVFYMQRHSENTILQVEQSQVDAQFGALLEERQPIVVRGCSPPKGLSRESLEKSTRLAGFQIGQQTLSQILSTPQTHQMTQGERDELGQQLSLPIWAAHTWLPLFQEYSWIAPLVGSSRAEALIGGLGMTRAKALYTCIIPTEGSYMVGLLSKNSEPFLPAAWETRYFSSLTSDDTPLVADLKYMDIVLNPGKALCIPAHMIFSVEPTGPGFHSAAIIEYHEPISLLAKSL